MSGNVIYYSEFNSLDSINKPIIDKGSHVGFNGHFDLDWDYYNLNFDYFGYGLRKNKVNDGYIYFSNVSNLFNMASGYLGFILSFPFGFKNGVYGGLKNKNYVLVNYYFLWGFNFGQFESTVPSIYAVLSEEGIEFTIWSSLGKYSIYDKVSNFQPNENVFFEFIWDKNGISEISTDEYLATMCLRINGVDIAVGNMPIGRESVDLLPLYVLDLPNRYFRLECTIKKLIIANSIPIDLEIDWYSSSSSSDSSESSSSSSEKLLNVFQLVDLEYEKVILYPNVHSAYYSNLDIVNESLQLVGFSRTSKILWLPSSGSPGYISKIDVNDINNVKEVARYYTGGINPSRSYIDSSGNCWITNRSGSRAAIKIGNTDAGFCRGECVNTSLDSNALAYGSDDAVLFEITYDFTSDTAYVSLPNTRANIGGNSSVRAIINDADGHVWINYGLDRAELYWFQIKGDGGLNGNGSIVRHLTAHSSNSYGCACSYDNNYIWSVKSGNSISAFSCDDPSVGFQLPSSYSTYGIYYSRGYIYTGQFRPSGDVSVIDSSLVNDPENHSSYIKTFTFSGVPYPRHFTVYVREDEFDDNGEQIEDLYISFYNGASTGGGLGLIPNHKRYLIGTVYPWGSFEFLFFPTSRGDNAGIAIMKNIQQSDYLFQLFHTHNSVEVFNIKEKHFIKNFTVGGEHYNYTNFTGNVDEINLIPLQGYANFIFDAGEGNEFSEWVSLCYKGRIQRPRNNITISVSSSNFIDSFTGPFTVGNCADLSDLGLNGRYFKVIFNFERLTDADESPLIRDFYVEVKIPT